MRRVAAGLGLCGSLAAPASAGPTTITAEGGGEVDSNVERVDSAADSPTSTIAAPVIRLGAKLDHRGRAAGGAYVLLVSEIVRRIVDPGEIAHNTESTALSIADLRWLRSLGARPVSAGFALSGADAAPLGEAGARTFRSLGADGLLVVRSGEDRSLTLAFGARVFEYKPNPNFDWLGPAVTARLDLTLWQPADGTRSVELAAFAGFEARAYDGTAAVNACPDDAMPDDPRACLAGTTLPRRDRYHRLGVELTWTGRVVAALGYQLSVTDSNSYGQSLVRHRASITATTDLPWKLYGTALATLQYDQYLDSLIIQEDLLNQQFTTLDDENRSSLQFRLARPVTSAFSFESRIAVWRDLDSDPSRSFHRELVYLGAVYSR